MKYKGSDICDKCGLWIEHLCITWMSDEKHGSEYSSRSYWQIEKGLYSEYAIHVYAYVQCKRIATPWSRRFHKLIRSSPYLLSHYQRRLTKTDNRPGEHTSRSSYLVSFCWPLRTFVVVYHPSGPLGLLFDEDIWIWGNPSSLSCRHYTFLIQYIIHCSSCFRQAVTWIKVTIWINSRQSHAHILIKIDVMAVCVRVNACIRHPDDLNLEFINSSKTRK